MAVIKKYIQYWNGFRMGPGIGDLLLIGTTLYAAYMRFTNNSSDTNEAEIWSATSVDNGVTWIRQQLPGSAPLIANLGAEGTGWCSLLEITSSLYALVFLVKNVSLSDLQVYISFSSNPLTVPFSTWTKITTAGYNVIRNNCLVKLASGRLIFAEGFWEGSGYEPKYYYSDNNGTTWTLGATILVGGLEEPSIVEISPGTLLTFFRTSDGFFWSNKSTDNGITWTAPAVTTLGASRSPGAFIMTASGKILAAFNPNGAAIGPYGNRSILQLAKSADGGLTWTNCLTLEPGSAINEVLFQFSYPSLQLSADGVYRMSYYEQLIGNTPGNPLAPDPPGIPTSNKFASFVAADIGE